MKLREPWVYLKPVEQTLYSATVPIKKSAGESCHGSMSLIPLDRHKVTHMNESLSHWANDKVTHMNESMSLIPLDAYASMSLVDEESMFLHSSFGVYRMSHAETYTEWAMEKHSPHEACGIHRMRRKLHACTEWGRVCNIDRMRPHVCDIHRMRRKHTPNEAVCDIHRMRRKHTPHEACSFMNTPWEMYTEWDM